MTGPNTHSVRGSSMRSLALHLLKSSSPRPVVIEAIRQRDADGYAVLNALAGAAGLGLPDGDEKEKMLRLQVGIAFLAMDSISSNGAEGFLDQYLSAFTSFSSLRYKPCDLDSRELEKEVATSGRFRAAAADAAESLLYSRQGDRPDSDIQRDLFIDGCLRKAGRDLDQDHVLTLARGMADGDTPESVREATGLTDFQIDKLYAKGMGYEDYAHGCRAAAKMLAAGLPEPPKTPQP